MRKNTIGRVSIKLAFGPRQVIRQRIWKVLNIVVVATMVANVSFLGSLVRPKAALAEAASVWTTRETCNTPAPQDENEYANGDVIYVRGANWSDSGSPMQLYWKITGKPGGASADPDEIVKSGTVMTDGSGYFCLDLPQAYTVGSDGDLDDGVYGVDVDSADNFHGSKQDNYHVNGTLFGSITVSKAIDTGGNGTFEGGNAEGNAAGFRWGVDLNPSDRMFGTTLVDVTAGNYDISENSQNGYHPVGWFYTNGDGSCSDPDGNSLPASITVASNEDTAVTICNARNVYRIQVSKMVVPLQGESDWNPSGWTWSLDSESEIAGGAYRDVIGGATHTITETPNMFSAPGYTTTWQCHPYESESLLGSGEGRTFNTDDLDFGADNGDWVYCYFTNREVPTYGIHGQKFSDLNGNGIWDQGELGLNGWTIFLDTNQNGVLDGEEQSVQTKNDDGQDGWYVFHGLPAGTYRICEVQQGGWNQTYPQNANNNCHSMTVGGELIDRLPVNTCSAQETQNSILAPSCNFGNQQLATLTVNKNYNDNGDGTVDRTNPSGWTWDIASGAQNTVGGATLTLPPGSFTVSEDADGAYSSAWSCTNQTSGSGTSFGVALAVGQNVTCTFTNTRDTGTIELKKVWSGPAAQTTLNIGSTAGGTQVDTQLTGAVGAAPLTTGANTVVTGTYFVSEAGTPANYTPSLACTDNGAAVTPGANNSVPVTKGHAVVCTFTNTAPVPQVLGISAEADLTIAKSVDDTTATRGQKLTYTLVVTNTGDADATNVVVTDNLPDGFVFLATGKATRTWNLGTLAAGATETLTYKVVVGNSVLAGQHVNRAFVTADFFDPIVAEAIVTVRVPQVLGLADTGAGLKDLLMFVLGLGLMVAGGLTFRRLRRSAATA